MIFLWIFAYFVVAFLKLRWFDRNREGGWLIMLTDRRNTNWTWLTFPTLALVLLTWPVGLVFKDWCVSEWVFNTQWRLCVGLRETSYYDRKEATDRAILEVAYHAVDAELSDPNLILLVRRAMPNLIAHDLCINTDRPPYRLGERKEEKS